MKKFKKEILAIIPARGGSKSIKNKNIVNLFGKPLIFHSIKSAKKCPYISRTIVSTDSHKIKKMLGINLRLQKIQKEVALSDYDSTWDQILKIEPSAKNAIPSAFVDSTP